MDPLLGPRNIVNLWNIFEDYLGPNLLIWICLLPIFFVQGYSKVIILNVLLLLLCLFEGNVLVISTISLFFLSKVLSKHKGVWKNETGKQIFVFLDEKTLFQSFVKARCHTRFQHVFLPHAFSTCFNYMQFQLQRKYFGWPKPLWKRKRMQSTHVENACGNSA